MRTAADDAGGFIFTGDAADVQDAPYLAFVDEVGLRGDFAFVSSRDAADVGFAGYLRGYGVGNVFDSRAFRVQSDDAADGIRSGYRSSVSAVVYPSVFAACDASGVLAVACDGNAPSINGIVDFSSVIIRKQQLGKKF